MPTDPVVIDLLTSIDASLKKLVGSGALTGGIPPVASDADLDGEWGNPVVRFNPRDWTGPSYKGRTFSQCPSEFLDLMAEVQEYFAKQSEAKQEVTDKGKPVHVYKRKDAARARGWAARWRAQGGNPTDPYANSAAAADPDTLLGAAVDGDGFASGTEVDDTDGPPF